MLLVGCGPKAGDTDTAEGPTSGTTTGETSGEPTSASAGSTASTTGGGIGTTDYTTGDPEDGTCPPDGQLCLNFCLHVKEAGAGCWFDDELCFTRCMQDIESGEDDPCGADPRATYYCESKAPALDGYVCEANDCAALYLEDDLCLGFCAHLNGIPSGGSSPWECFWYSECPGYGNHNIGMECPTGASPTCSCLIDDVEVGTCELGFPLEQSGCEEINVLSGCCKDYFVAAFEPALPEPVVCETTGGGEEPGGNPEGNACPLQGMYLPCTEDGVDGITYCDEIDGALVFGACLADPKCELGYEACDLYCDLVDGVPTPMMVECY
ncbi:MAG: hypothetical protein KC636_16415 [Myxococcales bacterium]|nr:hypothetical protein [Myxococcales bacterium]